MKKVSFLSIAILAGVSVSAQQVTDALRYAKTDITGTARYMGMGGAMGALGGDITTLSQNPAGIGVYRSSEIVITGSLGNVKTTSKSPSGISYGDGGSFYNRIPSNSENKFNSFCNTLGYVGTFQTGNDDGLVSFNFGFAYNRQGGIKRNYVVKQENMAAPLSDRIADDTQYYIQSNNLSAGSLTNNSSDKAFYNGSPWLSVLAYNTEVISNQGTNFYGMYGDRTDLEYDGDLKVEEVSHQDEYTFNFGGNISDVVYFGLGIGVSDLSYEYSSYYDEYYYDKTEGKDLPDNYRLGNYLKTTGTGFNFKGGIIVKPVQELRISAAVHTPTWYKLTDIYSADMKSFENDKYQRTPDSEYDYKLNTPWKYQFGLAVVVPNIGLVSFDYELADYSSCRFKDDSDFSYTFSDVNSNIKNQLSTINTYKVGAEVRLSKQASLRLGYANQGSGYTKDVRDNLVAMDYSGTITNYLIDKGTQYFTGGLGYRYGNMFVDMACVYRVNKQDAYLFPSLYTDSYDILTEPSELKTKTFDMLFTLGFKF